MALQTAAATASGGISPPQNNCISRAADSDEVSVETDSSVTRTATAVKPPPNSHGANRGSAVAIYDTSSSPSCRRMAMTWAMMSLSTGPCGFRFSSFARSRALRSSRGSVSNSEIATSTHSISVA